MTEKQEEKGRPRIRDLHGRLWEGEPGETEAELKRIVTDILLAEMKIARE